MTTALVPFDQLQGMAQAVAASGLFGMKTKEQALALMLTAQAEGQHPATITQDYDIIQGKACRKTHSVLARYQQAGGSIEWHTLTDKKADATFTPPNGAGKPLRMEWTFDMAKSCELTGKDNWKKYPRAMLRARCIAEGVRATYPAAIGGMMVAEEAQDVEERDITGEGQVVGREPTPMPQAKSAPAAITHEHDAADAKTNPAAKPHTNGNGSAVASAGHINNIRAKLKGLAAALGKDESVLMDDCLVAHQIKTLDGISVDTATLIQSWIKSKQAA